jgi:DNA-binding IclR family transcriptional regulator
MGKPEDDVVATLKSSGKALTLAEIAERMGIPEKKVYKALRKLFENGLIDTENRRYSLAKT